MDAANGITRKYSKTISAIFLTILSAFICRQLTKNDILPPMFVRPLGLIRSILYMGLFFAWGITLKCRIVHKMVRRYLIGIDGLILFWLIVRTLKFHMLTIRFAVRYMWYLYYLPMLFIPMCGVIIALTLGKPIDWRIPKRTLILWGVTMFLFLLVITNDLHQKVFVFPSDQGVLRVERQRIRLRYGILHCYDVADYLRASGALPDAPEMQDPSDAQNHDPAADTAGTGDNLYLYLLEQVRLVHDTVRRPHGDADYTLRLNLRNLYTVRAHRVQYAI